MEKVQTGENEGHVQKKNQVLYGKLEKREMRSMCKKNQIGPINTLLKQACKGR